MGHPVLFPTWNDVVPPVLGAEHGEGDRVLDEHRVAVRPVHDGALQPRLRCFKVLVSHNGVSVIFYQCRNTSLNDVSINGSAKERAPGCENAARKARQKW